MLLQYHGHSGSHYVILPERVNTKAFRLVAYVNVIRAIFSFIYSNRNTTSYGIKPRNVDKVAGDGNCYADVFPMHCQDLKTIMNQCVMCYAITYLGSQVDYEHLLLTVMNWKMGGNTLKEAI